MQAGKYFRMVDGDDWVETENLKEYIEFLKNNDADIVITDYTLVDNETGEQTKVKVENKERYKVLDFGENSKDVEFEMHNVTYKTDILKNNNIVLDNGFYTDVEYLLLPFPYIKKIAYLDLNIYMYRVSLQTQSVSMPSKQKNIAMHEQVLKRLINYYEDVKKKYDLHENVLNYMVKRISIMAISHLDIIMSFEPNKERKREVQELFKYLKKNSEDMYNAFAKCKKAKLLNASGFLTYSVLSKYFRKKNGITI